MLIQPLLDKLTLLRLYAFRRGLEEQPSNPKFAELAFEERLSLLVYLENIHRDNGRLQGRLQKAQLHQVIILEDFDFSSSRGIDRSQVLKLAQGAWIMRHLNTIVSGPTGTGKTFLGCALPHAACRMDFSVRYFRTPRFLQELKLARADGSYPKLLVCLARFQLIILDNWVRDALSQIQSQDLLDILDVRYSRSSTMIITQVLVISWLVRFPDPTIGDALLDRLVINAYRLDLTGESQRRIRSSCPHFVHLIYNYITGVASLPTGRQQTELMNDFTRISMREVKHPFPSGKMPARGRFRVCCIDDRIGHDEQC